MKPPSHSFRNHHLLSILKQYEAQPHPLDLFLKNYFRFHRAVGSKDRKVICETLYGLIRWRGLIDHFCPKSATWEDRILCFQALNPLDHLSDASIPPHVRVSFPKNFFTILEAQLGIEKAWEFCLASNQPAPTTIRINPLKTHREALLASWQDRFALSPCSQSPLGISFLKKENFFALPEFKEGLFEIQDEASQLIADLVNPKPSDLVLDYCAGAGGKTLAFAHKLEGRGQIYLHDIRLHALQEAKKRLKRAGIQNAQILSAEAPHKQRLKGQIDWILVDAPCSGTGTLRRNPDMKWRFDSEALQRLVNLQKALVQEALPFLKPKGRIVYATCSILPQENKEQLLFFEREFGLRCLIPPLETFPASGKMDGFFGAVLSR